MSWLVRDGRIPTGDPVVWVGVCGYEERCLSSLFELVSTGQPFTGVFDIEYHTKLSPERIANQRLTEVKRRFGTLISKARLASVRYPRPIPPYHLGPLRRVLVEAEALAERAGAALVLDVSCLTGLHAVGIASWLARGWNGRARLFVAYSSPEQYVFPDWRVVSGWVDTAIAPILARGAYQHRRLGGVAIRPPSASNVLALMGHDGARTEWAIRQVDTQHVWWVLAHDPEDGRADIAAATSRGAHQKLLDNDGDESHPDLIEIDKREVTPLRLRVESIAAATVEQGRRLVIVPLGPRPVSIVATLAAVDVLPMGSWVCYPIPDRIFAESSVGCRETTWFGAGGGSARARTFASQIDGLMRTPQ